MEVWKFIQTKLNEGINVMLLWVLESAGSSPGRRGFKMAVANDTSFEGTIGGGIMEHKLVEKARALLALQEMNISLVRQHHDKQHAKYQSGMICSGSQLIAFVPIVEKHLLVINEILDSIENDRTKTIALTQEGIKLDQHNEATQGFQQSGMGWLYIEKADQRPVIHIIGGGHVGLALSELMHYLGFYIKVYDNREGLNTMEKNLFAHEKRIINYDAIGDVVPGNKEDFVVIMTFGYRDDKIVFRQLAGKEFFYLGMMGSDAKIATLFKELEAEGFEKDRWKNCHAPIGINIFSKTAKEIAVSIAAEIIKVKNQLLPTGRYVNSDQ
jgi:xanthine dehydrogenase accessory factor